MYKFINVYFVENKNLINTILKAVNCNRSHECIYDKKTPQKLDNSSVLTISAK